MRWSNAQFITTKTNGKELPHYPHRFEAALVGRSNAGKSSFLNALTGKTSLAKTSKTPGKTRHLNLFSIDEKMMLVDLPGYGYAKRSKQEQEEWGSFISSYLRERKTLKLLLLIMDCRRGIEKEEESILSLSHALQLPVLFILNKCDTLTQSALASLQKTFPSSLDALLVSSRTGKGIDGARKTIELAIG